MTRYREILRLKSLGFSERNIALSFPYSRNTVSKVLKRSREKLLHGRCSMTQRMLNARLVDPYTGEIAEAYIFVGVMTYSQYAYVEAHVDEKQQVWFNCPCPYV